MTFDILFRFRKNFDIKLLETSVLFEVGRFSPNVSFFPLKQSVIKPRDMNMEFVISKWKSAF